MTKAVFPSPSLIDSVRWIPSDAGEGRAYLHARSDASASGMTGVVQTLNARGWLCVPSVEQGIPVLEIRGCKTENMLHAALRQAGAVTGAPQRTDKDKGPSLSDKLRRATLRLSGLFYLVGDGAFAMYGYKDRNPWSISAGVAYFLGSLSLMLFGRSDRTKQQSYELAKDLETFCAREQIAVPEDSVLYQAAHPKTQTSIGQKILDFCRKYPAELMNFFFLCAGVCIMKSVQEELHEAKDKLKTVTEALKSNVSVVEREALEYQRDFHKRSITAKWLDTFLGALTSLAGIVSIFGREKPEDPANKPKGMFGKLWDTIKRKPLTDAAALYIGSTLTHAGSTYIEVKQSHRTLEAAKRLSLPTKLVEHAQEKLNPLFYRQVFIGANIAAETAMGLSHKEYTDDTVKHTGYAMLADLLARMPETTRAPLIDRFSGYLAGWEIAGGIAADHAAQISGLLPGMATNPWREAISAAHTVLASPPAPIRNTAPASIPVMAAVSSPPVDTPATTRWRDSLAAVPPVTELQPLRG